MREIKFRAWDKRRNEYIFHDSLCCPSLSLGEILATYEVEQFTGLTDKDGNEIYEGDILRSGRQYKYMYSNGYTGNIYFDDFMACYKYGDMGGHLTQAKADYCEIIGNIHENPELL